VIHHVKRTVLNIRHSGTRIGTSVGVLRGDNGFAATLLSAGALGIIRRCLSILDVGQQPYYNPWLLGVISAHQMSILSLSKCGNCDNSDAYSDKHVESHRYWELQWHAVPHGH